MCTSARENKHSARAGGHRMCGSEINSQHYHERRTLGASIMAPTTIYVANVGHAPSHTYTEAHVYIYARAQTHTQPACSFLRKDGDRTDARLEYITTYTCAVLYTCTGRCKSDSRRGTTTAARRRSLAHVPAVYHPPVR